MGDIISILRHAKAVTDQKVREKILSVKSEAKTIVKVRPASPVSSSSIGKKNRVVQFADDKMKAFPASIAIAAPRRVLPEHEGKYKVSLPKGSTKKSREILAKHSASKIFEIYYLYLIY